MNNQKLSNVELERLHKPLAKSYNSDTKRKIASKQLYFFQDKIIFKQY